MNLEDTAVARKKPEASDRELEAGWRASVSAWLELEDRVIPVDVEQVHVNVSDVDRELRWFKYYEPRVYKPGYTGWTHLGEARFTAGKISG